jgi:hypothetical protein
MAELHKEGLAYLLGLVTAGNLSIGLCTDASLAEDATIASLTEVSGTGYGRIAVTSLTIADTGTNDKKATTNSVVFTAGGTWTGAKTAFIVTSTNKLLASVALSTTRTLNSGDTLTVAIEIDLVG